MFPFSSKRTPEKLGFQEQSASAAYIKSSMRESGLKQSYIEAPNRPFRPRKIVVAWILPQIERPTDAEQPANTFALTTDGRFGAIQPNTDKRSFIGHCFIRPPKPLHDILGRPLDSTGTTAGEVIGAISDEMVRVIKVDANPQAFQAVNEVPEAYEPADQPPLLVEAYSLSQAA